ncbi:hypothetical protein YC2023_084014 [Brassica napus]
MNNWNRVVQGAEPRYGALLHQASVYGVATGYCISASLLTIINKWAIMTFRYPGALTALQYFTSVVGVLLCGQFNLIEHDPLNLVTMWRFLPAAIIFYLSLFTNSELLLHSNVDTFIVFRSAVPILVAIGETLFLNRPWPSFKTWISLATILGGSLLYVLTDYQFTITAYSWAIVYRSCLHQARGYDHRLVIMGELQKLRHGITDKPDWHTLPVVFPVGLSCLFGLAISFFGFSCRRGISATGFTVLGIVNKLLTVVINLVIWDKHSSFIGTLGLLICMFGGVMYQQSTRKKLKGVREDKRQEQVGDQKKLQENEEAHKL